MATKQIHALVGFHGVSDGDVQKRGINIVTNLIGNSKFPSAPIDLAVLKADLDTFGSLISQSLDGSKKVIAEKNKQRGIVIKMLQLLGRYVELVSNGDMAVFRPVASRLLRRRRRQPNRCRRRSASSIVAITPEKSWDGFKPSAVLRVTNFATARA